MVGKKGRGGPKMAWKRQVEKQIELKKEDAIDRTKWRNIVYDFRET